MCDPAWVDDFVNSVLSVDIFDLLKDPIGNVDLGKFNQISKMKKGIELRKELSKRSMEIATKRKKVNYFECVQFCKLYRLFDLRNVAAVETLFSRAEFGHVPDLLKTLYPPSGIVEGILSILEKTIFNDQQKKDLLSCFPCFHHPDFHAQHSLSNVLENHENRRASFGVESEKTSRMVKCVIYSAIYHRSLFEVLDDLYAGPNSWIEEFGEIFFTRKEVPENIKNRVVFLKSNTVPQLDASDYADMQQCANTVSKIFIGQLSNDLKRKFIAMSSREVRKKRMASLNECMQRVRQTLKDAKDCWEHIAEASELTLRKHIFLLSVPRRRLFDLFLILIQLDVSTLCSLAIIREVEPVYVQMFENEYELTKILVAARRHWERRCGAQLES